MELYGLPGTCFLVFRSTVSTQLLLHMQHLLHRTSYPVRVICLQLNGVLDALQIASQPWPHVGRSP